MSANSSSMAVLRHALRKEMRQKRLALTKEQQQDAARHVAEQVVAHKCLQKAACVAVFLSFDGELDTRPLITQLWAQGKQVYLPILHPFSPGHLLFSHYTPATPLIHNRFHIEEPQLDIRTILAKNKLDVILTPLVAFDNHGQRLGMGGGFYDRILQNWQQDGPYPIGIAHDCQLVESLPTEPWDISLPEIITPSRHWIWQAP